MGKILKVLNMSLLVLGASFLQATEDTVKKELSTRVVALIDAYTSAQLNLHRQHHVAVTASLSAVAVVPVYPLLEGTETKVLLECMGAGDMRPYFDFVKNQKVAKINTFVDGLLAANDTFIDEGVNTGGGEWGPLDRTRDALKVALGNKVRGVVIDIPAPTTANIKLLYNYHTEFEQEIVQGLEEYISLFAPSGDTSNFLAESVNRPEYRSRGMFKKAIKEAIFG